jgi:hypothetical protein
MIGNHCGWVNWALASGFLGSENEEKGLWVMIHWGEMNYL